jgi:hypothetical protein|tara:strand:+ start:333 stop:509 length:177 start_codon:yes stop_codon:yes gene_type:complete
MKRQATQIKVEEMEKVSGGRRGIIDPGFIIDPGYIIDPGFIIDPGYIIDPGHKPRRGQ